MNNRLQELTDKLYQEGISKSNDEAASIIAAARKQAEKMIAEARQKADEIRSEAEKKASELAEHTNSEIKLAARQATDTLKQQIAELISHSVLVGDIRNSVHNPDFIQQLINSLISHWASSENKDMTILISPDQEKELQSHFSSRTKDLLDKGFTIKPSPGLQAGFQIGPADGSYKISFTDSDFISFFEDYLRPETKHLLFGEQQ